GEPAEERTGGGTIRCVPDLPNRLGTCGRHGSPNAPRKRISLTDDRDFDGAAQVICFAVDGAEVLADLRAGRPLGLRDCKIVVRRVGAPVQRKLVMLPAATLTCPLIAKHWIASGAIFIFLFRR